MNNEIKLFINILNSEIPDLMGVYLFGSRTSDSVHLESDWDLAILARDLLPAKKRFDIAEKCARACGVNVDLVDLKKANLVLIHQILSEGKLIFEKDKSVIARFETTSMARYCNFNEERKEILKDIAKRGKIHE